MMKKRSSVSTHPQVVSTLDQVPKRPICQFWTNVKKKRREEERG
ncbi:hypothetical protein Taro_042174 [Colocasia esculenta]|uniref:Uncharacterized protein n=1 Tax=Colocasia esculenta TaxID=4460 RepID=A0A843WNT5_COLES|nr:hypothetical protein [Colocasia esculenta]